MAKQRQQKAGEDRAPRHKDFTSQELRKITQEMRGLAAEIDALAAEAETLHIKEFGVDGAAKFMRAKKLITTFILKVKLGLDREQN